MNPIAIVHGIVGILMIAVSLPLVMGKIRRNRWYGIRVHEAFESEERWLEINRYGGRLMLRWSVAISVMAGLGLALDERYWIAYSFGSLVVLLGGLGIVIALIPGYVAKTKG